MTKIAFLGVGNMGGPMAANLVKAGFDVNAFDVMQAAIDYAVEAGCRVCDTPVATVEGAEVIISMLPSGAIVEGLYIEKDHLLEHISTGALILDCSTIAPENSKRVGEAAANKGIEFIDAPVSGGVAGAAAGTLAFMCGGSTQAFERAQPVLQAMGKNIFYAGDMGAGQVAKMCNNMLLAVQMIGSAETLQMGMDNGLDPAVLTNILNNSTSGCWSLKVQNPVPGVSEGAPAGNDYQGGFMTKLMQKDLSLAKEIANGSNSTTPMGDLATALYGQHSQANDVNSDLDFSSVIKLFKIAK